jgi:hypothetical protein
MNGIIHLKDLNTGVSDLTNKISKFGYNDTPLFNLIQKGVPDKKGESWKGHEWKYEEVPDGDDDNAHLEGSGPADAQKTELGSSKNHYQIIKHSYGITGSMEGKEDLENKNILTKDGASASIRHRKTIEKMLFSDCPPVQRDVDIKGKSAGLRHWCTVENTVDTTDFLSMKLLRELTKIGFLNGINYSHIFVNTDQKDALDDILSDKQQTKTGLTVLEGTNYELIKNMAYSKNLRVIVTPELPQDEILAIDHKNLMLVYQRLTKSYELARTEDAIKKELISELTVRNNNPFSVARIKGLKV